MNIDLFGNVIQEEETFDVKVNKPSPFGFVENIAKKNYPESIDGYVSYITNLAFSQRKDLVFYANEMNRYHALSERQQFDFYFHALPKKNLFAKWAKGVKSENSEDIMEYFGVSSKVAQEYEKVLTKEQIEQMKEWCKNSKGGR